MNLTAIPLIIRDPKTYDSLKEEIKQLEPWYQPIRFDWGLKAIPTTKNGDKIGIFSLDRGIVKWWRFIRPNLPFSLTGRTVMDVGCNAGLFLLQSVRMGAAKAIGIEADDHYFKQANFVIQTMNRINNRPMPIEVYQSTMEAFDMSRTGRVDLTLFLNSIYHIGKVRGEFIYPPEKIHRLQVDTLKKIARNSKYILFQANSLEDEGRGKGRGSLLRIVNDAGLSVHSEKNYSHSRGYILVVKGL